MCLCSPTLFRNVVTESTAVHLVDEAVEGIVAQVLHDPVVGGAVGQRLRTGPGSQTSSATKSIRSTPTHLLPSRATPNPRGPIKEGVGWWVPLPLPVPGICLRQWVVGVSSACLAGCLPSLPWSASASRSAPTRSPHRCLHANTRAAPSAQGQW